MAGQLHDDTRLYSVPGTPDAFKELQSSALPMGINTNSSSAASVISLKQYTYTIYINCRLDGLPRLTLVHQFLCSPVLLDNVENMLLQAPTMRCHDEAADGFPLTVAL